MMQVCLFLCFSKPSFSLCTGTVIDSLCRHVYSNLNEPTLMPGPKSCQRTRADSQMTSGQRC